MAVIAGQGSTSYSSIYLIILYYALLLAEDVT